MRQSSPAIESALERPELKDYRGWLKFLRYEAQTAAARHGADSKDAREKMARLKDWMQRIDADPQLLGKLRGVQEWAYESPVDGTGQPFKIMIPTDYDPAQAGTAVALYAWLYRRSYESFHGHAGAYRIVRRCRARAFARRLVPCAIAGRCAGR